MTMSEYRIFRVIRTEGQQYFDIEYVKDLVTCGECRHCLTDIVVQRRADGYEKTVNLCRNPKHTEEWSVPKDWYCADAERRENE